MHGVKCAYFRTEPNMIYTDNTRNFKFSIAIVVYLIPATNR